MSYSGIAREKAELVERTGLLGAGMFGSQVVSHFFIEGFGTAEQRAAWSRRVVAVAISEPRVGAHPKLLTTRAEEVANGYAIFGEKAWVTNGPLAEVFVVVAITSIEGDRKHYSAFLVPRDTPGLSIAEAPEYRALAPSRHCGLKLDGCHVQHSSLLGTGGTAYETMALPFRDVEDAVGTFGLLGAFRFMLARLAAHSEGEAAILALGRLASLVAVFAATADSVVAALDAGELARQMDVLVGLRVLAAEIRERARQVGATDEMIERVFDGVDRSLSVARGPREARQKRLGAALIAAARPQSRSHQA
jgi:acyl-CoA dehydrogenase